VTGRLPSVRPGAMEGPDEVDLHLDPQAVAACRQGMINVVDAPAGTGKMAHMSNMLIAGKTGTAQAAPFKVLQLDESGKAKVDEDGKRLYTTFEPSTPDHPNTGLPWYRGTGTKDNYKLDHAWMIGFAPADNPKIAFAVLVEYGGSGGGAAADVVKYSLDACIAHGYLQPRTNLPKPLEEEPEPQAIAAPAPGSELLSGVQPDR
jgi:cell division protein FtsI/penicillin-binding protein 2